MTPTDILTAARALLLSPVVPAREEWLVDWCGPVQWCDGEVWCTDTFGLATGPGRLRLYGIARFRLDLRRPEVRDRLVRCGVLPAPLRDHVGMMRYLFAL